MYYFYFFYASSYYLPSNNIFGLNQVWRFFIVQSFPVILIIYSAVFIPKSIRMCKCSDRFEMLWIFMIRLLTSFLVPIIVVFIISPQCMGYWKLFWNSCIDDSKDQFLNSADNGGLWNYDIGADRDSICDDYFFDSGKKCFREIVGFISYLSLTKMILSAFLESGITYIWNKYLKPRISSNVYIKLGFEWNRLFIYVETGLLMGYFCPIIIIFVFIGICTHFDSLNQLHTEGFDFRNSDYGLTIYALYYALFLLDTSMLIFWYYEHTTIFILSIVFNSFTWLLILYQLFLSQNIPADHFANDEVRIELQQNVNNVSKTTEEIDENPELFKFTNGNAIELSQKEEEAQSQNTLMFTEEKINDQELPTNFSSRGRLVEIVTILSLHKEYHRYEINRQKENYSQCRNKS